MFLGFDAVGMAAVGETVEERFAWAGDADWFLDWVVHLYTATHEYISRPLDTPSSQLFKGTLQKAFRIDRSVIGNQVGEEITIGYGEVQLTNIEGDYDFLAVDHTPLGQVIEIKMGNKTRPLSEWRTVLSGFMTGHHVDRNTVFFELRDGAHHFDVAASSNVYLGTGGTEGTSDLEGKRKPRWFGWCLNVSPPLVIPSSLSYQLNDGVIDSVSAVYIRGVAQSFVANYATVTLMNAASLSVGQYATCLAEGWIRIGVGVGTETSQVTCDFCGDKAGGVFVYKAADIVHRLIEAVVDPDDISEVTFTALNTLQPAPIGYGIPVGDEQTVATAVSNIMRTIGGWCGARRSGRFEVKRLSAPASPPVARYTRLDIVDVQQISLPSEVSPPPWRIRVGYSRNHTIQTTDLAGSVSESFRSFLSSEYRYGVAEDTSIKIDFPPGSELVRDGYFRDKADAEAEALRYLDLYANGRALYVVKLASRLFVHEIGQVVHITFPRFNLAIGRYGRIVRLTEDDTDGVELTVFV